MIDTHCHIDFPDFDRDREEIIAQAEAFGVTHLINIGTDKESSRRSVALADKYPHIYATVGVHPHDSRTLDKKLLSEIEELAGSPKVVGIGEIGLDYYRNLSPHDIQRKAFVEQLELAIRLNLPVVIHVREAMEEALEIVERYAGQLRGVFHCFPGTTEQAQRVAELGFYIAVNGVITYPKSKMAVVASEVDLETVLIETDCPYLTPVPYRGKRNVPGNVKLVCERLAELRDISVSEADKVTTRNAEKLFGLVETFGG